jgi:hypothetical protein
LLAEKKQVEDRHEQALTEIRQKLADALSSLDSEYTTAAADLDAKYQKSETLQRFAKPSRELLELRTIAQRLLKQNRGSEVAKYSARIALLEQAESQKCADTIQRRYEWEDRNLKETFAARREVLCKKFAVTMEEAERKAVAEVALVDKRIAKLQGQLEPEAATTARGKERSAAPSSRSQSRRGRESGVFATTGKLRLAPPKPIRRENDLDEIGQMTIENLNHGSPRSARVDALLRATIRVGK